MYIQEERKGAYYMGATLNGKKVVMTEGKNRYGFALVTIFMIWLFWPHNNSFIRLSYWSYNLFYNATKVLHIPFSTETMYHRNNAIYLARINKNNSEKSLNEIQRAVDLAAAKESTGELEYLYKERAILKLYYGDKDGALEDYEKAVGVINEPMDNMRLAILLTDNHKYKDAVMQCKRILWRGTVPPPFGYVCLAYVYEKSGSPDAALSVYDWAIDRGRQEAYLYIERANLKKRMGDDEAYIQDINNAKKIDPDIKIKDDSFTEKALNLKNIPIKVK